MNTTHVTVIAAALFAAQFAAGAPPAQERYTKKETAVEPVPQTALTKPQPKPAAEPKPAGPTITVEQFIEKKRERIVEISDRQIEQMKKLIALSTEDDPQKPDLWFRLGELYAEKQRYFFVKARELDEKIYQAPPARKPALQQQQQDHERRERSWLLESARAYIEATKHRKYERMDEVLFKLAYLLTTAKKEEQAREFFHRLIKDYPTSKYIPDAYLSFAEHFFEKGEMDAALRFYERVEQFPSSSVHAYAVYKKGWCWINLGQFKDALTTFVNVVRSTENARNAGARQLAREARKDIVRAYARVGTADRAWELFQRTGGDYAPKMMELLAELYWDQGAWPDSTKTYHRIISMNMESPRICEWQQKIVRNALSGGTKRDQAQELQRLGTAFEKLAAMKDAKPAQVAECRAGYHDTTKELALVWHKEAQKTQNLETYALAQVLYKEYLDHFQKDAYDMRFYHAELLWVLKRWREAADEYTRVVELDPRGKHLKEAAYAAVLAWQNLLGVDDHPDERDRTVSSSAKLEKRPLPESQQRFIAALETYERFVPDDPDMVKIIYRIGRTRYEYNWFAEAQPYFEKVVDRYCSHELAPYAANLALDCMNALGKTRELTAYVDRALANRCLMRDVVLRDQLTDLKADSFDLEGRSFEKARNFKECGRSFLAAAETMTKKLSRRHAERLTNAGTCFQNARLVGQALSTRLALVHDHEGDGAGPESGRDLARQAIFRVASGYHQLAAYSKAADYYEEFARKFPGEARSVQALGNASMFRIGLGEVEKAKEDMKSFIAFYGGKKPLDAAAVAFQMSEIYERDGKWTELAEHLHEYLKRWGAQGGVDRQILAHFRLGEMAWKQSCANPTPEGACAEVKRLPATGSRRILDDLNRKMREQMRRRGVAARNVAKITTLKCGPEIRVVLHERSVKDVRTAAEHFDEAIRLWAKGDALKRITGDGADARRHQAAYAVAGAYFHRAEALYEDFLRVRFPEGLDFSGPNADDTRARQQATERRRADAQKRFVGYLQQKGALLDRVRGLYLEALGFGQAHWAIAAAARVGQIYQDYASQLFGAEIPKDLPEVDQWGNTPRLLYCDTLVEKAEPIETKALQGFSTCLETATKYSWYNGWSRLCERELNQLRPAEYPLSAEIKPDVSPGPITITPVAAISELP